MVFDFSLEIMYIWHFKDQNLIFRNLSYVKQILNGILHMFKKTMMKPKQFLSANNNVLLI